MDPAEDDDDVILSLIDAYLGIGPRDGVAVERPDVVSGADRTVSARVELEDVVLWNKFSEVTNEMIVTKSGR